MPAIIFFGILLSVLITLGLFLLMFLSVAFTTEDSSQQPELSQEEARALLRRVANRRIDPDDGRSPTLGQLVRLGHLIDKPERSTGSGV
jgi:hypothetical protein